MKISIHALRVEGDRCARAHRQKRGISIHALRVEGDANHPVVTDVQVGISIHALRVEGDKSAVFCALLDMPISIHALRVEGDTINLDALVPKLISIHALRVEGDLPRHCIFLSVPLYFYPRPPGGGRPPMREAALGLLEISIHALRVEGDNCPRHDSVFPRHISIHALRVEGDRPYRFLAWLRRYFYPRPPGGGRLYRQRKANRMGKISIHALRVEGDAGGRAGDKNTNKISIHALRVEGDVYLMTDFPPEA